jgi:hypothetical protein
MPASLFVVIVSFPFFFSYTCSFEFIVTFYLTYVMFLFVGHSGLAVVTRVASCGAAWLGAALDSHVADG